MDTRSYRESTVHCNVIQSTLVISKSKGIAEILRDIRTLTYQICRNEENNKSNNQISQMKYAICLLELQMY